MIIAFTCDYTKGIAQSVGIMELEGETIAHYCRFLCYMQWKCIYATFYKQSIISEYFIQFTQISGLSTNVLTVMVKSDMKH